MEHRDKLGKQAVEEGIQMLMNKCWASSRNGPPEGRPLCGCVALCLVGMLLIGLGVAGCGLANGVPPGLVARIKGVADWSAGGIDKTRGASERLSG